LEETEEREHKGREISKEQKKNSERIEKEREIRGKSGRKSREN